MSNCILFFRLALTRNQLPRQERETFMGLLRFLSLPVDDFWFSAVLLILVRLVTCLE